MPQPITHPEPPFVWGAAALVKRRKLALGIAAVAVEWTNLENRMALAFGYLLGGGETVAHDIYHGFFDRKPRDTMFLALARERLDGRQRQVLEGLQRDIRRASEARNAVVHATWAANPKYPHDLLSMDWRAISERFTRHVHNGPEKPLSKPIRYQETDFIDILERIRLLQERIDEFGKELHLRALRSLVQSTHDKPTHSSHPTSSGGFIVS